MLRYYDICVVLSIKVINIHVVANLDNSTLRFLKMILMFSNVMLNIS